MSTLRGASLCYLATPYTHYRDGIDAAYVEAARTAARLLAAGVQVFSPIAHSHPLALHGSLDPLDRALWLPFNEALLRKSDVLIVVLLDGWEQSRGVLEEIEHFHAAGKPVFDCDPVTLLMRRAYAPAMISICRAAQQDRPPPVQPRPEAAALHQREAAE